MSSPKPDRLAEIKQTVAETMDIRYHEFGVYDGTSTDAEPDIDYLIEEVERLRKDELVNAIAVGGEMIMTALEQDYAACALKQLTKCTCVCGHVKEARRILAREPKTP